MRFFVFFKLLCRFIMGLLETIEILADEEQMADFNIAVQEIENGELKPWGKSDEVQQ